MARNNPKQNQEHEIFVRFCAFRGFLFLEFAFSDIFFTVIEFAGWNAT